MDPFTRHLHIADNIKILRNLCTASVDLIYLDPPFNSGKQWENPVQVESGKKLRVAFKDVWHFSDIHADEAVELQHHCPKAMEVINALHHVNGDSWRAYLIYMGVRLVEMRRVLKDTGSIYYHCDQTMSHGVKLVMDAIFGGKNFLNHAIWNYDGPQSPSKKKFATKHDDILRYAKNVDKIYVSYDDIFTLSEMKEPELSRSYKKDKGGYFYDLPPGSYTADSIARLEAEGRVRRTQNGKVRIKYYLTEKGGKYYRRKKLPSVWKDIPSLGQSGGKEKRGYATQKPLALLERIIKASSNECDLVLDPFCGCATACVAAERLGRQWIGIDIAGVDERIKNTDKTYKIEDLLFERIDIDCRAGTLFSMKETYKLNPKIGEDLYKRIDLHPYVKNDLRANLYSAQGKKCIGCDKEKSIEDMDLDHIIPRERGGQDEPRNYQLLCGTCNSIKGSKTQTAWRRKVLEKRLEEELERETKLMLERRRKMKLRESE